MQKQNEKDDLRQKGKTYVLFGLIGFIILAITNFLNNLFGPELVCVNPVSNYAILGILGILLIFSPFTHALIDFKLKRGKNIE